MQEHLTEVFGERWRIFLKVCISNEGVGGWWGVERSVSNVVQSPLPLIQTVFSGVE